MRRGILVVTLLASVAAGRSAHPESIAPGGLADLDAWPREFRQGAEVLTMYQPQVDGWNGLRLDGQAAVSVARGDGEPTFGVMWFTARTIVNKDTRMVMLEDVAITRSSFPSATAQADAYAQRLRARIGSGPRAIALDRLEADLALSGRKAEELPLRHDAPRFIFSSVPALLVPVDGAPTYAPVDGTGLLRVVNTRVLLVKDAAGRHFVRLFDGWLEAASLEGPWRVSRTPSRELETARRRAAAAGNVDLLEGTRRDAPAPSLSKIPAPLVHVSTTPAELIVTDGPANWGPVGGGTQLLYVKNTSGHVFKHLGDQATYVLVSGRWFRATSPAGPWSFVAPSALPADFARIPDESPKENVKASVAGTPQAEEALIANLVPQTAKVDRRTAQLAQPRYDGEPQLRPIEGTSLQYVVNSPIPIIVVSPGRYFAVQNGVWFVAPSLQGPWRVADSVPAVVYTIPPRSPVHFVTYVRVYDVTPDVVYVGYTPGYFGTCVSGGVVVYGTGYAYTPWVGTVWYAPPVTYGFGASVAYTPWTGWAYGVGFGGSAYAAAVGPYGAAVAGPGGWAATTGNVYSRWGSTTAVSRASAGYDAWTGNAWAGQAGASYNSRTGVASAGQRGGVQNVATGHYAAGERGVVQGPGGVTAAGGRVTAGDANTGRSVTAGRGAVVDPNTGNATSAAGVRGENGGVARVGSDVYAGRDGNVYRHGTDGWQQYQDGSWTSLRDSERARSLEGRRSARGTGESRVRSFRQSGSGRTRPSGGFRRPGR